MERYLLRVLAAAIGWVFLMSDPSPGAINTYYDDLAGFNAAAGSPPVAIGFDDITPGTDITGTTLGASLTGWLRRRRVL